MQIPTWKYCKDCCTKLGIDFETQKPSDYMSEEEKEMQRIKLEKAKLARKVKINSKILQTGKFHEFIP